MKSMKTDWLEMETRIRAALRVYRDGEKKPNDATLILQAISDIVGEETGRGFVLDLFN